MILFLSTKEVNLNDIDDQIFYINNMLYEKQKSRELVIFYMDKVTTSVNSIINPVDINSIHECLKDLKHTLDVLDKNINSLKILIKLLDTLKEHIDIITEANIETYNSTCNEIIDEYFKCNISVYNLITRIMQYVTVSFPENESDDENINVAPNLVSQETFDNTNINSEKTDTREIEKQPENYDITESEVSFSVDNLKEENVETSLPNNTENINLPETSNTIENITSEKQCSIKENPKLDFKIPENTLIISEKDKKVILPFTIKEVEEKRKENSEKISFQDIIDQYYSIPLKNYKNSSLSRFKEAYKLIKNKENGSIKEAFDLGLELFFNYNLNPAIITACRNLNELDIYLSYLEDAKVSKFKCFDIVYECRPVSKLKRAKT